MVGYEVPRSIAHERLDDEVIAIDLATGAYYSLRGAAADAWVLLAAGCDVGTAGAALAAHHGLAEAPVDDVAAFAAELVAGGLLAEGGEATATAPELPPATAPYSAPSLEKFDDLEELLLLDPIHEVDEAGWPTVPTEPA